MMGDDLTIGFDADDTLWHNETIFENVHLRYRALLGRFHDAATVDQRLFATEMRNLERYGYGVKGFMLSAIETAIELSDGQISAEAIRLPTRTACSSSPKAICATRSASCRSADWPASSVPSKLFPRRMPRRTTASCVGMVLRPSAFSWWAIR